MSQLLLHEFSWLRHISRPIRIDGRNVQVLHTPDNYFKALKNGIRTAKQRVVFSSLYLGTGSREAELTSVIKDALSDNSRSNFKCTILLDHLRGSRGHPNSRTMLQDLVCHFGNRMSLYLYHTPNLRGVLKWVGPERFNEVMGLQHMKIYLFDNDLLLSGANLSQDYFVDRQDRYLKFHNCPELADYFASLVDTVASHSYKLRPDGTTDKPTAVAVDPLSSRKAAESFRTSLGNAVKKLTEPESKTSSHVGEASIENSAMRDYHLEESDTIVYPLVQMGYYGIRQDEIVTQRILQALKNWEQLYLASGYFNLPPVYVDAVLRGKGVYSILAASPPANGFYGAKGVAGHVPYMYIHFARKFLEAVSRHGCEEGVHYMEFYRQGWTYHGKGLWYYLAGEKLPSLTLMGSSNYGCRSLSRDLEAQVAMVTKNEQLKQALHEEQRRMFGYGRRLSLSEARSAPERQLNFLQWLATQILKPHV